MGKQAKKKQFQNQGTNMTDQTSQDTSTQLQKEDSLDDTIKTHKINDGDNEVPDSGDNKAAIEVEETTIPAIVMNGVEDKSIPTPEVPVVKECIQVEAKPTVADVSTTIVDKAELTEYEVYIEKIRSNGSLAMKSLLMRLEGYVVSMAPGKILQPTVGANNQRVLWDCLIGAVKNPDNEEFRRQWNLLLQFFNVHKNGALGPHHVFRFSAQWTKGKDELELKQVLINLIHLTADHTTREKGLKQVDLARTVQSRILTEAERSRIQGFYNM